MKRYFQLLRRRIAVESLFWFHVANKIHPQARKPNLVAYPVWADEVDREWDLQNR